MANNEPIGDDALKKHIQKLHHRDEIDGNKKFMMGMFGLLFVLCVGNSTVEGWTTLSILMSLILPASLVWVHMQTKRALRSYDESYEQVVQILQQKKASDQWSPEWEELATMLDNKKFGKEKRYE